MLSVNEFLNRCDSMISGIASKRDKINFTQAETAEPSHITAQSGAFSEWMLFHMKVLPLQTILVHSNKEAQRVILAIVLPRSQKSSRHPCNSAKCSLFLSSRQLERPRTLRTSATLIK
jgi:hypothetical protein